MALTSQHTAVSQAHCIAAASIQSAGEGKVSPESCGAYHQHPCTDTQSTVAAGTHQHARLLLGTAATLRTAAPPACHPGRSPTTRPGELHTAGKGGGGGGLRAGQSPSRGSPQALHCSPWGSLLISVQNAHAQAPPSSACARGACGRAPPRTRLPPAPPLPLPLPLPLPPAPALLAALLLLGPAPLAAAGAATLTVLPAGGSTGGPGASRAAAQRLVQQSLQHSPSPQKTTYRQQLRTRVVLVHLSPKPPLPPTPTPTRTTAAHPRSPCPSPQSPSPAGARTCRRRTW
jgi:hypothetical protein